MSIQRASTLSKHGDGSHSPGTLHPQRHTARHAPLHRVAHSNTNAHILASFSSLVYRLITIMCMLFTYLLITLFFLFFIYSIGSVNERIAAMYLIQGLNFTLIPPFFPAIRQNSEVRDAITDEVISKENKNESSSP